MLLFSCQILLCMQMRLESSATNCSQTARASQYEWEKSLKEYKSGRFGGVKKVKVAHDEDVSLLWAMGLNSLIAAACAL